MLTRCSFPESRDLDSTRRVEDMAAEGADERRDWAERGRQVDPDVVPRLAGRVRDHLVEVVNADDVDRWIDRQARNEPTLRCDRAGRLGARPEVAARVVETNARGARDLAGGLRGPVGHVDPA